MPLTTSFSSLSHPNFLPRRGSVNNPNQWKSLEARSGLLRGLRSNSHLNSRNKASWHKDQSNSGVVFLSMAAQPILHKPSSFPALHELICPGHTKPHFINKKILTVHNLYYISVLSSIFLALYSTSPKPITDCIRSYLSKRSEALLVLPKLRLSNHQKNWPYRGLKIWNSFINICSSLGLLEKDKLVYWKHTKFKKVAKSLFLRMQTLSGTQDWYPANYNIFEVEAKNQLAF